jgi:hypothetical protein
VKGYIDAVRRPSNWKKSKASVILVRVTFADDAGQSEHLVSDVAGRDK